MGSLGAIYRGYGNIEAILLGKQTNVILAVCLIFREGISFSLGLSWQQLCDLVPIYETRAVPYFDQVSNSGQLLENPADSLPLEKQNL